MRAARAASRRVTARSFFMRSCSVSCMVASLRASCASDCGRSARCGGRDELSRHSLHPFHPSSRHAQIVLYARTPVKTALDPRKQLPLAPTGAARNTTRSLLASCRAVCAVSLAARQLTPPQMRDRRRDRWQQRAPPSPLQRSEFLPALYTIRRRAHRLVSEEISQNLVTPRSREIERDRVGW